MFEKYNLISDYDGLKLSLERSLPKGEIKGIVQIAHGMAEHKERYEHFMTFLAQNGYGAIIHDHRGHGDSVRKEEDFGYFYTEDPEGIIQDLYQVSCHIKMQYPEKPLYLFSHSMGTLVARCYMKDHDDQIGKLILCGPPTENRLVDMGLMLAKLLRSIKGGRARSRLIQKLVFGAYDKNSKRRNSWLSTDEGNVSAYNEDPRCGFIFTNNGFINLFKLLKSAYSKNGWQVNNPNLPVFVIAGVEDPVIQSKKYFVALINFLRNRGYRKIEQKLYSGRRHELLNDINREAVYQDILNFLNEK